MNSHTSNSSSHDDNEKRKRSEFRSRKKFSDVNIIVEGESFACHRIILASSSEYFETMFDGNFCERDMVEDIILNDVDKDTFELILDFIYTGKVELTNENIFSLLQTSDYLSIRKLEDLCINFILRSIPNFTSNVIDVFLFAFRTDKKNLLNAITPSLAANFMILKHWDKFLELPYNALLTVLESEFMKFVNQDELLNTLIIWIQHDPENRKSYISSLLEAVDFNKISGDYSRLLAKFYLECDQSVGTLEAEYHKPVWKNSEDEKQIRIYVMKKERHQRTVELLSLENNSWSLCDTYKFVQDIPLWKNLMVGNNLYSFIASGIDGSLHMKRNFNGILYNCASIILPECMNPNIFDACVVDGDIYVYGRGYVPISRDFSKQIDHFYSYNCEVNEWTIHPRPLYNVLSPCMISRERNIYLLGINETSETADELLYDGCAKKFQFYDKRQGKWTGLVPCPVRSRPGIMCTNGTKIFVVNSRLHDPTTHQILEYDIAAGRWNSIMAPMKTRKESAKLLIFDDKLWAIGGNFNYNKSCEKLTAEYFDFTTNKWESIGAPKSDSKLQSQIILDATIF